MKRGGWTLVSTLVTIALLGVLAVAVTTGGFGTLRSGETPRADGKGKTVPGLVKAKAEDEVCRSNLGQVRQALQMAQTSSEDNAFPATLEDLRLGTGFQRCPMGKEPYQYDPATGTVRCPHPGHENF